MTPLQRQTCEAVVSIFETGHLPSPQAYATCTILADGAGISYGVHQATAASGSLRAVLDEYTIRAGSYAAEIRRVIGSHSLLESTWAHPPAWVAELMGVLRHAGSDTTMQRAQDDVFGRLYWEPASQQADALGVETPLGHLALYDLAIHSGLGRLGQLRPAFPELPPVRGGSERAWVLGLLAARRAWLERMGGVVARTTYRVVALQQLAAEGRWDLARPLTVRGVEIR